MAIDFANCTRLQMRTPTPNPDRQAMRRTMLKSSFTGSATAHARHYEVPAPSTKICWTRQISASTSRSTSGTINNGERCTYASAPSGVNIIRSTVPPPARPLRRHPHHRHPTAVYNEIRLGKCAPELICVDQRQPHRPPQQQDPHPGCGAKPPGTADSRRQAVFFTRQEDRMARSGFGSRPPTHRASRSLVPE